MSDTEINIAIAEAHLGQKWESHPAEWCGSEPARWLKPQFWTCDGKPRPMLEVRHYTTDLNAIHEAEKTLTEYELQGKYPRELAALVVNCGWLPESATSILRLCHATARQRAEAFLRTIGKWKE